MKIKKDILALMISLLLAVISIGFGFLTNYELNYKHYIGILLVFLSAALYFKNKRAYQYLFGITLVAGAINLIDFFFINVLFSIGPVGFNPVIVCLLFLFISFNQQILDTLFPDKKETTEKDILKEEEKKEMLIQNFERKFENKSAYELESILDKKNAYVDEARIAAERLMNKKYRH
tara:strand:+ start:7523 stop:8053 length:531 start_codon:yes stop_codon:yes gene_type:complete